MTPTSDIRADDEARDAIFPAFAIRPDELARAVEERGFESLFASWLTRCADLHERPQWSTGPRVVSVGVPARVIDRVR